MIAWSYFLNFQGTLAGEKSEIRGAAIARIKNRLSTWAATPALKESALEGGDHFPCLSLGGQL